MSKTKKTAKTSKSARSPKAARGRRQPAAPPVIPEVLQTPEFLAAWAEWERFHADRGIELTAENTTRQLKLLARFGSEEAVEDIRKTIEEHPTQVGAGRTAETEEEDTPEPAAEQLEPLSTVQVAVVAPAEAAPSPVAPTEPGGIAPAPTEAPEIVPAATEATETPLQATPAAEVAPPQKPRAARAPRQSGKLSAIDAAAKVLEEQGGPMSCQEMIDAMAAKGYWSSPGGKTPAATLYSAILHEMKVKQAGARFQKTGRGRFACRRGV